MVAFSIYAQGSLQTVKVTFETTYGSITLEIYPEAAPNLSQRFLELCRKQHYTGTYFHFVDAGFIIAGGDLTIREEPLEKDIIDSYDKLPDEISAKALGLDMLLVRNSYLGKHLQREDPTRRLTMKAFLESQGYKFTDSLPSIPNDYGYLAMASNQPNSNRTQFFIVTAKEGAPWLNGKNTVLGKVIEGMDVVHIIESLPHDEDNNPLPEQRATILNTIVE